MNEVELACKTKDLIKNLCAALILQTGSRMTLDRPISYRPHVQGAGFSGVRLTCSVELAYAEDCAGGVALLNETEQY